jgi:hypothetical protein
MLIKAISFVRAESITSQPILRHEQGIPGKLKAFPLPEDGRFPDLPSFELSVCI